MKPLKIYMLIQSLGTGGAERVFTVLASQFADQGHQVFVFVDKPENPYKEELSSNAQLIILKKLWSGFRPRIPVIRLDFFRRVFQDKPDIIFATGRIHNLAAIIAGIISKRPVVIRETNTASQQKKSAAGIKGKIEFALMKCLYPRATAVVSPSEGVKEDLEELVPVLKGITHVIPNPVDLQKVYIHAQEPLPDNIDFKYIMSAGRLVPQKGFDILIRAWAKNYAAFPVDLIILGEGPERQTLIDLSGELGLKDHLHLPGFDLNPYRFMARAELYVLSSYYEGLPNALLQAIASRCPVVATDCKSGPREILNHGEYGQLAQVGDVDSLADAMAKSLASKNNNKAAYEAMNRYDSKQVATAYINLFQQKISALTYR